MWRQRQHSNAYMVLPAFAAGTAFLYRTCIYNCVFNVVLTIPQQQNNKESRSRLYAVPNWTERIHNISVFISCQKWKWGNIEQHDISIRNTWSKQHEEALFSFQLCWHRGWWCVGAGWWLQQRDQAPQHRHWDRCGFYTSVRCEKAL